MFKCFFFLIFSTGLYGNTFHSYQLLLAESPEDIPSQPIVEPPNETDSPEFELSDELQESVTEKRQNVVASWHLGVGSRTAWQQIQAGYFLVTDFSDIGVEFGGGRWSVKKHEDTKDYRIEATTRSLAFGLRQFIIEDMGLYLMESVAYLEFDGTVVSEGAFVEGSQETDARFAYHALGISVASGWQWVLKNNWYLDLVLIGMHQSWMIEQTTTDVTVELKNAVEAELEERKVYGLLNIAFGKYID